MTIVKKGVGKYQYFIGIVLTLSFMISLAGLMAANFVYAEDIETYNTSRPIINVNYHELPVAIINFSLVNSNNIRWNVREISNYQQKEYNFTVDYLSPGNYTFSVRGMDPDGNTVDAHKDFIIDYDSMKVWLHNPRPAVGKTQSFNLTIASEYNASCKYGYTIPDCGPCDHLEQACLYDCMHEEFDITHNKTLHKETPFIAPASDSALFAICRIDMPDADLEQSSSYGETNFMAGYDMIAPSITSITAIPNPVQDAYSKHTVINVTTNEPTVCRIKGANDMVPTDLFFNDADPTEYEDYTTQHNHTIWYTRVNTNERLTFPYNITCFDRAQWLAAKNITVIVNFNSTLMIKRITPEFVSSSTFLFEVETNIQASCSINYSNQSAQMSGNGIRHGKDMTIGLGNTTVTVRCTAGPQSKIAVYKIRFDNVPPTLELRANPKTCSLEEINVFINASDEGSGVDELWYTVLDEDEEEVVEWTQADPHDHTLTIDHLDLKDAQTYEIKAHAIDGAGLDSGNKSDTIVASGPGSDDCDFTRPTVIINVSSGRYQKNITVKCKDADSGCTDSFRYELLDKMNASCNNVTYPDTMRYSDLPLTLTDDKKVCIIVFDKNGNNATASQAIYVNTAVCGNNELDPGEECDGTNLGRFTCALFNPNWNGVLGCYPAGDAQECQWNTDNCGIIGYGYCGDNKVNNYYNEQCDGTDWGQISKLANQGCKQFGFDGGTLKCTPNSLPRGQRCMFDTDACYMNNVNNRPKCDGTSAGPTTLLDPGEQCEISEGFTLNCTHFDAFSGGTLTCTDSCVFDLSACAGQPTTLRCGNGIVEAGEQCDPSGSVRSCEDFPNRTGGVATCKDNCKYDFDECGVPYEQNESVCGNSIVEDGEMCDGKSIFFQCSDFELGDGFLSCDGSCDVDTTHCLANASITQVCGNSRTEPGEECDAQINELTASSFADALGCDSTITCDEMCRIGCAQGAMDTCSNLVKDGDETGFNCGGSCLPCAAGETCQARFDCESGICIDSLCQEDTCANGVQDIAETGIDCGGSCAACAIGDGCISDDDCESGSCKDNVCVEAAQKEESNPAGLILIIIGLILILAGGGYIIYKTYFDKSPHKTHSTSESIRVISHPVETPVDPRIAQMQKNKQEQRRAEAQKARKSLLEGFDKTEAAGKEEDIAKLKERKAPKEGAAEYVDLTQETQAKSSGVFDKLKDISRTDKTDGQSSDEPSDVKDGSSLSKLSTQKVPSPSENADKTSAAKDRRKAKKSKSANFEKLGSITQSAASQISDLTGKSRQSIARSLKEGQLSSMQASEIFSRMDRATLTSDKFKKAIKQLEAEGKIDSQTLSTLLFEYMDRGVLQKSDVAQIMSELKMLK